MQSSRGSGGSYKSRKIIEKSVEEFFYLRCKERKKNKKEKLLNDAAYGKSDSEGVKND